eukprot:5810399-Heterocapsa_arctica.AAC.1
MVRLDFQLQGSCGDFLHESRCTVELDGDDFFLAPEALVAEEFNKLATLRHCQADARGAQDKDCTP